MNPCYLLIREKPLLQAKPPPPMNLNHLIRIRAILCSRLFLICNTNSTNNTKNSILSRISISNLLDFSHYCRHLQKPCLSLNPKVISLRLPIKQSSQ